MKEFQFTACIEIKELLGRKATDVQKLLELIEDVPVDSIYYHTHSYFLRHSYIMSPYPNDFANWVATQVRDRVLGEKLGCITPLVNKSIEDMRSEIMDIIEQHLTDTRIVPYAVYGEPFHFMKSKIIEVPTGIHASDLNEFIIALKRIDASAIYNHIFEARMRIRKGRSDFSIWLSDVLGLQELTEQVENVDSYMYSLDGLRHKLLALCTEWRDQHGQ